MRFGKRSRAGKTFVCVLTQNHTTVNIAIVSVTKPGVVRLTIVSENAKNW